MPKYVIEHAIPGVGNLSREEIQAVSGKSCGILQHRAPSIEWVTSYVTLDKIYCVYIASSEGLIREHAKQAGFPTDSISEVRSIIDPTPAGNMHSKKT
ncbi:MAG: DUF4242 domain-containing protein [Acidobacteriota bacterium]